MRVLFLPLITGGAAIGTITRCLAIADQVREFGHEAFFLTNGEGAKYVSEGGFSFMEGVVPDHPGPHHPLHDLSDAAVFLNLTKEDYLRRALESEKRAVDRFQPDVLVGEFKLTAPITAASMGLPIVSTACTPADPRFVSPLFPDKRATGRREAIGGFNRILDEHGLAPIRDVAELFFSRSTVKIAPTAPEIEPMLADVPDLYFVGYLLYDRMELAPLPPGLLERARGKNVVFAYFSTGEITPALYTRVIPEAYAQSEFHAIVAVGDHPDLPTLPENTPETTWLRFVPGRSILQHSQALLFHGGQNTAMAALLHGVPSLVFPGSDFERDFNARALARIGAGLHYPVEDFTPAQVLEGTRHLLKPSFRQAAETYASKIAEKGGPNYAAQLVLQAARGEILATQV